MSLDNLLDHINKNALKKAKEIEAQTQKEAEGIVEEAKKEATRDKKKRLEEAKKRAVDSKEAQLAKARLEAKNLVLIGKRQYLEKAFDLALNKLNKEKGEAYTSLIINLLVSNSVGNEEVLMTDSQAPIIVEQANSRLAKEGRPAELKPSKEKIESPGFILVDERGSKTDFTFESIVDFYKDKLEKEVHSILVGDLDGAK